MEIYIFSLYYSYLSPSKMLFTNLWDPLRCKNRNNHRFTQPDEVNPTELPNNETTPDENHQYNGTTPSYATQPSLLHSLLIDASVTLELFPLCHHIDPGAVDCVANTSNFPKVNLMASDDAIFSVYQDWVHQNTSTHLDGGSNEYGKWKYRF